MRYDEAKIQESVVLYVKLNYPKVIFTCAPATAKNVKQGARNKKMGYLPGWPDLFFASARRGYNGLAIELKTPKGRETTAQKEVRNKLIEEGYKSVVCYSYEEAVAIIDKYFK